MQHIMLGLAIYGVFFIIAEAKLLSVPRDWLISRSRLISELLTCAFCLGFWVSLGAYAFSYREIVANDAIRYLETVVVGSFAGATFTYALNTFLLTLEAFHARNHQAT